MCGSRSANGTKRSGRRIRHRNNSEAAFERRDSQKQNGEGGGGREAGVSYIFEHKKKMHGLCQSPLDFNALSVGVAISTCAPTVRFRL